jgi:hypothetical protein
MTANLAQARERSQHVHLAFVDAFFGDDLHDLVAAAAQFSKSPLPDIRLRKLITSFNK